MEAKIRSVAFVLRVDVDANGKVGGATVSDLAPGTYIEYISANKDKIDLSSLQKFVEAKKMVNQSVMIPFYTTVKDTKGNKSDIDAEKISQFLRFGNVYLEGNCYWLKPVLTSFNVPSLH
ncbi:MAG: hypothetical protein EOO87_07835 [Pedobacter sp.]|nr:MAG: hypothetical protein EOO87_07835 [Pedobacter sp.]